MGGIVIAASARSAAIRANKLSEDANHIAARAEKSTEALEKKLLRAEHELEEYRKNFSKPIVQLIVEIDSMADNLDVRRKKKPNHEKTVRSFESDVWEILHRKIKAFLLRSIEAKFIGQEVFIEIETAANNPVDIIFESLDELARSESNSERATRATEKFEAGVKALSRKLMFEKEACGGRLFEKFGLS